MLLTKVNRCSYYPLRLRCAPQTPRGGSLSIYPTYLILWHGSVGEAAPRLIHQTSMPQTHRALSTMLDQLDLVDHSDPQRAAQWFRRYFLTTPAARAAIEMILYDQAARALDQPLHAYLDLPSPNGVATCYSIKLGDHSRLEADLEEARGYKTIKVHCSRRADNDIEGLKFISRRSSQLLQIDVGGTWSMQETESLLPTLASMNVECLIQPLERFREEDSSGLRRRCPFPILMDTNLSPMTDPEQVARVCDGFTLDPMICGGLTEALRLIERARQLGLLVALDCGNVTSAGLTAAAHLAGAVDYVDISGKLALENDPIDGVRLDGCRITLPDRPGIGAWVRNEYIDHIVRI